MSSAPSNSKAQTPTEPKNIVHDNEIWRERIKSESQAVDHFNKTYAPLVEQYFGTNRCRSVTPDLLKTGTFPPRPIDNAKPSDKLSRVDCMRMRSLKPCQKTCYPFLTSMQYGWESSQLETFDTCAIPKVNKEEALKKEQLLNDFKKKYI
ncbi:hypothetical protein P9112_012933 [Eukaryota sp. TZLM1-RC]